MRKSSVHSVTYVLLFLLIISVIVYLNIVFQENLKADIARQFNQQQLLLARGAADRIEKRIDNYARHLISLSQFPSTRDLRENAAREQLFMALVSDDQEKRKNIFDFQIIDSKGFLRLDRSHPNLVGLDLSNRNYFLKTKSLDKGEVYISGIMHIPEQNPSKRYVVIATPLQDCKLKSPNCFAGVALFSLSVEDLAGEYLSHIRIGERGYAWVMDSQGTLVYHPTNPEMIGRNLQKADKSCFACHKSFDAEKKILEGTVTQYGVYTAPMGEDKLISFSKARVGSESWLVFVTTPYSEVTALIAKSMKLYSWLISIIFFTVIGTSFFFIVLIKKKTEADERARHAAELEDKVRERTAELFREKEKLNAILSAFGVGVSLIDSDYDVLWGNEIITQNVPYSVGKKCYAAYRNLTSPCPGCPLPRTVASGRLEHTEMVCRRPAVKRDQANDYIAGDLLGMLSKEGTGYFQIVIAPMKDLDGKVTQVVELIQDVTGVRRLEQQMMHSEKLAALGRISAGVAHEIGNPLTSIYSFIQILQEKKYDEFTNGTLDTIAFHINRIREILLQMSGFSSTYQTSEKGPVDVNEAVKATLDLMSHEKGLKGSNLTTSYHPDRLTVVADEKWLVSVFVNLVINALDAMPGGGTLSVRTYRDDNSCPSPMAVVEISDTGTGIPHEDIEKIFDPFYTTKPAGKGTGLGLAVSYNIIKDLEGDISVVSHPGMGTTFTVMIPMEASVV